MKYYIKETVINDEDQKLAQGKARNDANDILQSMGFEELLVKTVLKEGSALARFFGHIRIKRAWKESVHDLKEGDYLVIQAPCLADSIFWASIPRQLEKRGIKIIFLLHDINLIRSYFHKSSGALKKIKIKRNEKAVFNYAFKLIAHNENMKQLMVQMGVEKGKIVTLEIFDYLIKKDIDPPRNLFEHKRLSPVIIAGNLSPKKANYVYHLPAGQRFNLYGVQYQGTSTDKICYKGAFDADELPIVLEGSFGLVWDGDSATTCEGIYGEYLKVNNPHKTSLYLAAGFPVLIWREAALSKLIEENECGILIDSLSDIPQKISNLSNEEYMRLIEHAQKMGKKLREGHYLKTAISKSVDIMVTPSGSDGNKTMLCGKTKERGKEYMQKDKKVSVVIVTYNRKELLCECLDALLKQKFQATNIYVIDNASTDGTKDAIDKYLSKESISYFNTGTNLGGAGGFNYGMNLAAQDECDYIWVMDDDTIPEEMALAELIQAAEEVEDEFGFLSSYVKYTDGAFCLMNRQFVEEREWIEDCGLLQEGLLRLRQATFVSLLVKRQVVFQEGLPIKEFFIWGDDTEYTLRLSQKYKCYFVVNSIVIHKMSHNYDTGSVYFLNDSKGDLDRYYYNYRNLSYIYRNYYSRGMTCRSFLRLNFNLLIKNAPHKFKKFGVVWKGYLAGIFFRPQIEHIQKK